MIAFLPLCYAAIVWVIFFKLALLPWNRLSQGAVGGIGIVSILALLISMILYQPYSTDPKLADARWSVKESTVEAPANGSVTNLALRPGQLASTMASHPVMRLIQDDPSIVIATFPQSALAFVRVGDPAKLALSFMPGRVIPATVQAIIPGTGQGQLVASGKLMEWTDPPVEGQLRAALTAFRQPTKGGQSPRPRAAWKCRNSVGRHFSRVDFGLAL